MVDLIDCPSCGSIYVKNKFREVCDACFKEEEKQYDAVYKFLRVRENRAATISRVVEETGIEEDLLLKFIRTGRIKVTSFPNLGYPCDSCGRLTTTGKLCDRCTADLKNDLRTFEAAQEFREAIEECSLALPKGQLTHVLRHTFASHFIMNGGNILVLQRILGHSSLTMTMRYAHLAPENLKSAVAVLDRLRSGYATEPEAIRTLGKVL